MNFNFLKLCLLGLFFLLIQSCGSKEDGNTLENNSEPTLFTLLQPEETGISFVNKVANSKNSTFSNTAIFIMEAVLPLETLIMMGYPMFF